MQLVKMGYKNLARNWRHSTGSILAAAIGFAALTLFNGYISMVKDLYEDNYRQRSMFGDVIIEKTRDGQSIDFEESNISLDEQEFVKKFFQDSGMVNAWVPMLIVSGMANNGKSSAIFWGFAYDLESGLKMRQPTWSWNVRAGKPLDQLSTDHVMLGPSIFETFGCDEHSNETFVTQIGGYSPRERPFTCERNTLQLTVTTKQGQVNAEQVKIGALGGVGLRGIDSWYMMMDLARAQRLFDTQSISHVRMRLKNPALLDSFMSAFNAHAQKSNIELRASDWRDHILARVYKRTMSLFQTFRNLVSAVILTISGMSVLNAMVKSVNERHREIGTLLSIGFFKKDIRYIFAAEGLLIGFIGSLFGTLVSILFSLVTNQLRLTYLAGFLSDPVPFFIAFKWSIYFLSAGILCSISTIAAYLSANRAVKQSIPQLLTSV